MTPLLLVALGGLILVPTGAFANQPSLEPQADDLVAYAYVLAARHAVMVDDAALRSIPSELVRPLASVFAAFLAFEDDAAVLAEGHLADEAMLARRALLDATLELRIALAASGPVPVVIDASPAFALDLAGEDSAHARDVALQIDAGGNDVYTNRAGGGGVGFTSDGQFLADLCRQTVLGLELPPPLPAGYLADFAGNDRYVSGRDCGVNGGAMSGAGFLYDAEGDDVYESGQGGVNGGAFLAAAGFLRDDGGHDAYVASVGHTTYAYGANGAGSLGGNGLLVDAWGDDRYVAGQEGANGGGYGGGTGALIDGGGNDSYVGTALGVNGAAQLGQGLLWDAWGNDEYLVLGCCGGSHDPMDNGGGERALACLYDGGGRDRYLQRHIDAWDVTVMPKGDSGAQIDLAAGEEAECPGQPTSNWTPWARGSFVV